MINSQLAINDLEFENVSQVQSHLNATYGVYGDKMVRLTVLATVKTHPTAVVLEWHPSLGKWLFRH